MQQFHDTATNEAYDFEDDVKVSQDAKGHNVFHTPHGVRLKVPNTLVKGEPKLSTAEKLANAQSTQKQTMDAAYANALQQPQSYTTKAGKTAKFTPDKATRDYLLECELGFRNKQATPSGFMFEAHDGTEIAFAYADLLGLAEVLIGYGNTQYRNWKKKYKAIDAVTTSTSSPIKTVEGITW